MKNYYIPKPWRAAFFLKGVIELKCGLLKLLIIILLFLYRKLYRRGHKTNGMRYFKTPIPA